MKGQNFASRVLSRHTFRISRKKGSDFFDHRGTLTTLGLVSTEIKNLTMISRKTVFPSGLLTKLFVALFLRN